MAVNTYVVNVRHEGAPVAIISKDNVIQPVYNPVTGDLALIAGDYRAPQQVVPLGSGELPVPTGETLPTVATAPSVLVYQQPLTPLAPMVTFSVSTALIQREARAAVAQRFGR